jgi:hypothetical protein
MINTNSYQARQFNLSGLNGISDRTLEMLLILSVSSVASLHATTRFAEH